MTDEDLSLYEIAYNLRIPVYKLMEEMPYDELLRWYVYFDKRPPEWRADDRAAKLLQAQGVKEKAWNLFPSLQPIYKKGAAVEVVEDGQIDSGNLKSSFIFHKMLSAVGGDKLDL